MLEINGNENKSEVVRAKLLRSKLFTELDKASRIFGRMESSTMPNVIEWIGRYSDGFSAMYNLSKSTPWLFQLGADARVSKTWVEPPTKHRKVN